MAGTVRVRHIFETPGGSWDSYGEACLFHLLLLAIVVLVLVALK